MKKNRTVSPWGMHFEENWLKSIFPRQTPGEFYRSQFIPGTEKYLKDKPIFVSFPRSGSVWTVALLELYLSKPRYEFEKKGIHWLDEKFVNEECAFSKVHDNAGDIQPSSSDFGDIFLIRDPVDAIYSRRRVKGIPAAVSQEYGAVKQLSNDWKVLTEKWINSAKTIIVYELSVKDPIATLKILSEHFNVPWDESKAKEVIAICGSKEKIMTKVPGSVFHSPIVLEKDYEIKREEFRNRNQETIYNIVTSEKTENILSIIKKNL